jgi:hypothetical protein
MPDNIKKDSQIKSNKFSVETVLSTSVYAVTAIMILAYLYQSFSAHF